MLINQIADQPRDPSEHAVDIAKVRSAQYSTAATISVGHVELHPTIRAIAGDIPEDGRVLRAKFPDEFVVTIDQK